MNFFCFDIKLIISNENIKFEQINTMTKCIVIMQTYGNILILKLILNINK